MVLSQRCNSLLTLLYSLMLVFKKCTHAAISQFRNGVKIKLSIKQQIDLSVSRST